jgi:hypothetical protein
MKMYGVSRYSYTILNLSSNGGKWIAFHSYPFTAWEILPGTHWVGGWVGPRAGLDVMEKHKMSCPCSELNSDSSAVQTVA